MSNLVRLGRHRDKAERDSEIAIITIDNPPVNALTPGVPGGIASAIEEISNDPSVKAAVLIGGGRTFVAGADIKEFGKMTSGKTRGAGLLPLLLAIENCRKPIVMAIHGAAFGGGLELAMAGHYRVAASDAQVGQPEVKLGLIPGAAGTQRLPRLVGVAKALEMCTDGKPVAAAEAFQFGIIDRLIEGDLLAGAVAFAREIAGKPAPKTRERAQKLGTAEQNAAIISVSRERVRTKQRNLIAPLAAIDAGEVANIPDVPKDTSVKPIRSVAVVGSGTMGGGIAMVFANAGIPVLLKEVDQFALDQGLARIRKNYDRSVHRGRFTQLFVEERFALITPSLSCDNFADADMVIEAVFEGMALKKQVFRDLDRACKPGAILASNTSTLSIDEIASVTSRPESVIGTHFFSPANIMRLLEIVRGKETSKEGIASCMQLSKKLGKIGVLVGNCRGFVGNRMFGPYRREAQFLIEEGAEVEAVDNALVEFGMAMGPLATGDLAGLDVGWRIRKEYRHLEKPGVRQPIAEDNLCEMGRYGQKTLAGWYRYDDQRRTAPDPEVTALVRKWTAEAGIFQRRISTSEMIERCVYALVNEGARILEEGYALRSVDIDIIYLNGYGFPAHRGGPMWYADTVGLRKVYDRVCEFRRQHGELWEPAPLLKRLAEANQTFAEFGTEHVVNV